MSTIILPRPWLLPLALFYLGLTALRNWAFDIGWLKSRKADIPTVCVGNLEVGGTGKTPVVELVAKIMENCCQVAILSRGYGRNTKGFLVVEESSDALQVGDEPLMLKRRMPQILVAVCEDRLLGVNQIKKNHPRTGLVILDDAFQHRNLKPDLSIIVTSGNNPYWKQWMLPSGTLRESIAGSKRADALMIIGVCPGVGQIPFHGPVLYAENEASGPFDLSGNAIQLQDAVAFCGIANPDRFFQSSRKVCNVVKTISFADHYSYTKKDVDRLISVVHSFGRPIKLITTEKDMVRLGRQFNNGPFHEILSYLKLETQLGVADQETIKELIIAKCLNR